MIDSRNDKRPLRKLTVKNFSVIKDAETTPLEFGKITVLIGPQASGKSLLCKLDYFFEKVLAEQAEEAVSSGHTLESFKNGLIGDFAEWFSNSRQAALKSRIQFVHGDYKASIILQSGLDPKIEIEFPEIGKEYEEVLSTRNIDETNVDKGLRENEVYRNLLHDELNKLRTIPTLEIFRYIPSTRAFFVTPQKAVFGAATRAADDLTLRFARDFRWQLNGLGSSFDHKQALRQWIQQECERLLSGEIRAQGNHVYFSASDDRILELNSLSSGTQELLPLLHSIREFVWLATGKVPTSRRVLYVEEPEANVFPSTQYDLVRIFSRMTNESALDASWVITTHSPYILSAFNNLIEAFQVARAKPELKSEVAKLIDEHYWINPEDIKAYSIHDGKLESIIDEETGLISDNYLDQVSETIGKEFDELLRLGYVES